MQNLNRNVIVLLSLVLIFKGAAVYAEEAKPPETTLENELNQAQTPPPTTTEAIPTEATSAAPVAKTPQESGDINSSETSVDNDYSGGMEDTYAMNGYSLGLVVLTQNYNVSAELFINGGQKVDLSVKSPDFQSVGVMARYAILPHNKVGADLNVSIANSVNPDAAGLTNTVTARAEINLGYAIPVGKASSIYALAGGGYEVVIGKEVKEVFIPGGSTLQIGGGAAIGKKVNLELMYSYSSHDISQTFSDNAINTAKARGATSIDGNDTKPYVVSNIIQGRLVYNY